jgi:hypothetical protein
VISWFKNVLSNRSNCTATARRCEVIAAIYDGADCAEIGVFDKSAGDAPLGFVNVPVRRLPRGYPMVSTLALMGGVNANPLAEITVRAHYKPLVSAGATLFQYFAPPLPRSAYIFGNTAAAAAGSSGAADVGLSGVEQLVVGLYKLNAVAPQLERRLVTQPLRL